MTCRRHHNGFTLLELLLVVGVIGIMVGLLLPAIQASREAARRTSCSHNFRQIALGALQYHSAFDVLPPHGTGTFSNANNPNNTNQFRLSFLVSILPFTGQAPTWDAISGAYVGEPPAGDVSMGAPAAMTTGFADVSPPKTHRYPSMGPVPSLSSYYPWRSEPPLYRCPSDPGIGLPSLGRTNYAACLGDAIEGLDEGRWRYDAATKQWSPSGSAQMQATARGMFTPRMISSLDAVTDGLSNTIMFGEIATDLGDRSIITLPSLNNGWKNGVLDDTRICISQIDSARPRFWKPSPPVTNPTVTGQARGYRWADAMPLMTGFNTVLAPNRELCFGGASTTIGTLPASSRHQGGAHIAMADGAIVFMTDSVDVGDANTTVTSYGTKQFAPGSPSPFGLWGALGTQGQGELIDETLNQ